MTLNKQTAVFNFELNEDVFLLRSSILSCLTEWAVVKHPRTMYAPLSFSMENQ